MPYIDEKFKDNHPVKTVEKIKGILDNLGIKTEERWNDSGIDNCFSLSLSGPNGIPKSNGKGITKEFARASAYAEFIERLQGGLFFYKYQSLIRVKDMNIHAFAPDAKYMTVNELIENGEWMDHIINTYKDYPITRTSIAKMCKMYACTTDERILTVPFYSLFEKKYVYLPIAFVDQMYTTNGCCAGNTREEAWVHALSEMMERHASINRLLSGKPAPRIPDEVLNRYPVVSNILQKIRNTDSLEVEVFDYSLGNGYPIVSTRIIDKARHSYKVNVASDPVFEIALQRTLTELFQGHNIDQPFGRHSGQILNEVSDFPIVSNVTNQLESGSGLFTADYFANELNDEISRTDFADNSNKTNKELLSQALEIYKSLDRPVYVRNFSYLGFHSYRFIVPGFSETRWVRFGDSLPEYSVLDDVCKIMRNVACATNDDLSWMLSGNQLVRNMSGRYSFFNRISGALVSGKNNSLLAGITRSYAAYRLGSYKEAIRYINECFVSGDDDLGQYLDCVKKHLELKQTGIAEEKIKVIIRKFFHTAPYERLYRQLDNGGTPYDDLLIKCDYESCETCRYKSSCAFETARDMNRKAGAIYREFIHGQDESEFAI